MKTKNIVLFAVCCLVFSSLFGCEAFVKKFTRKPKKEKPAEEMILVPEEYPVLFENKEQAYRQYFLYWKSWQDELINALLACLSQKKQLTCIDYAIKNLEEVKKLLDEEKRSQLDSYITESVKLRNDIDKDTYANNTNMNRVTAERIKRKILRDFSYSKVKDYVR